MSINFINFNQDFSCLAVASSNGYQIYNCDPFGKCFSKDDGAMGLVEMLFSTSLVAIVGMGDQPTLSPRRLRIMNTKRDSTICELTFPTAILRVKLNRKRLVVLLEEQVYIYDISNMKLLHTIETSLNSKAVCALSPSSENCYFVYPSGAPVSININLRNDSTNGMPPNNTSSTRSGEVTVFDTLTLQPVNVIEAHKSPISLLTLNNDGTLMATASDKGTIIRVFAVPSGALLYQFRRGTYPSKIFSMNFSLSSNLLAVSSATETVHIFRLKADPIEADRTTAGSLSAASGSGSAPVSESLSSDVSATDMMSNVSSASMESTTTATAATGGRRSFGKLAANYLPNVGDLLESKPRDFAFFKIPVQQGTHSAVALNSLNHVMVVTSEGYFYQYSIDLEAGGECQLVRQYSLS